MTAETLVREYRRLFNGSLIENRSTYLNDVDQVAAIQLSVLFLQKEHHSTETLTPEQLFEVQRKINARKTSSPEAQDGFPYTKDNELPFDEVYNSYVSFTKHCNMIDNGDVNLLTKSLEKNVEDKENDERTSERSSAENPVSSPNPSRPQATPIRSSHPASSKSPSCWKTPLRSHLTTYSSPFPSSPKDPSTVQLRRVIVSYMQLIVNSRNEIALARVIDLPTRGIDRRSFTDIRKVAVEKRMPMYQVISSFVRQCILGGKGYAPSEDHALYQHKAGLMEFIDLMDKLQTIVDESTSIHSLLTDLFKTLKVAFVRAKQPVFSAKSVATVVHELQNVARQWMSLESSNIELPLLLRDFIDLLSCLAGNEISLHSSHLCGILSTPDMSSTTYKKINTLVTSFKTPLPGKETPIKAGDREIEDVEEIEPLTNSDIPSTPIMRKGTNKKIEEEFENAEYQEKCEIDAPVKLIRCKISTESQKEVASKPNIFSKKCQVDNKPKSKNAAASADANTPNAKDIPNTKRKHVPAKAKSKCAKKIKLVSGQKTLSQFFKK